MRFNFLMTLIKDCQAHLDKTVFNANNLVVSYKIGVSSPDKTPDDQGNDQIQNNIVEFQRMYCDLSRFTSNIYYICRDQITSLVDSHLLTEEQKQEMQKKQIDIYKVISNPFYYEEL